MMRLLVAGLGVFLAWTALAHGQAPSADQIFSETVRDFGSVPRGAQLYHRFVWTNTERVRREVTELRSTCACLTATPVPRVVEPGQQGVIEVVMDGRKFVGPKTVTLHVMIGPDRPQAVVLQVSANSRADVVFNPGDVNFGVLAEGSVAQQTIQIEYAGTLEWKAESVQSTGPHLEAALEEDYRRTGQVGYRLKVTLRPTAPAGDFKHMLQIKTNDPANPVLAVLVSANIRPSLVVVPAPLYFGGVKVSGQAVRRVTLRAEKPFSILGVDGLEQGLSLTPPGGAATVQSLNVTWRPDEAGELSREIVIRTDLERYREVRLKVQGEAVP